MTQIRGTTTPPFAPVVEELQRNFDERGETGCSLAVFHRGELVVDLWGGHKDAHGKEEWDRDTLVLTYSTTKPIVASCVLLLVDEGRIGLDDLVTDHWPEFGRAGKRSVTVRHMLTHQAGLPALRTDLPAEALFDRKTIVAALEAEEPWWEPGTKHGEHAYFYGHLIDELVRRVDGRSAHTMFAEEIADRWQIDFHVGLDEAALERTSHLSGIEEAWPGGAMQEAADEMHRRALTNPPGALDPEVVNSDRWKLAEVPAINGYGSAYAIARFYQGFLSGGVLDGARVFSEEACREATSIQSSGLDVFLERHVDWGLGFQIEEQYFGHGGLGGSSGYAARELDIALAYVTNKMAGHDRAEAVCELAENCARASTRSLGS